jgi:membrane fusion protein (multidrug efflux system)
MSSWSKKMSTTTKRLLWLVIAAVALAALLVPRLQRSEGAAETAAQPVEEALGVETLVVTPGRLVESFATVGTIRADEQVEIRSEISGILEEILFEEGSRVGGGQLLVRLDDSQFVAERDRAVHRRELAQLREARLEDLLEQGLTSQDEYDLSLSQLQVLDTELRLAEARLEKTRIQAPFGGMIGLRSVSRGSAITPSTRIATLQKIDRVKLEFSVPEGFASRLETGADVGFTIKGSEREYIGSIYAIEPNVDQETRSLRARALSPNPDGRLLPGAFADVQLAIREIDDALTVPAIAVIPELGSKKVFVFDEGRAVSRLVETGIRNQTDVQITSGLEAGETVIVSAIQQLSSGRAVRELPAP